ncbi:MAG: response regulator [Polyangiaceae bacterium]|nr:response regulator [Polyangiaceae bacterium]MCE7889133.1 response regulator [Sorangiineae bacterium PRO1]MCL4750535.1 response regulator [Myxococcales bacterium]
MIEAEEALPQSAGTRVARARAEFVATLGRRLTALRNTLQQLEDAPSSRERRDMLQRRLHALGSAARVLGFDGVADALEDAERALGRSAGGGPVSSTELAEVSRALDLLPSIAWGAKPPRSGVELPDDVGLLASGWPLCILVFGPPALESSLAAADEEGIEVELAADAEAFRELAERVGPDVAVIDGDLRGARELIENLAHDPNLPSFPVIVVGSFEHPEAASGFVSLGAARVLPKPVGPDALWRAVLEACQHETGLRGPREPIGDVTVDELAQRIAAEVRRGLVEGVEPASSAVSVPLGEGTDVLAAVWGAVARVRELLTMRSRGSVRFTSGGPEGAVPLAPWTGADRRAGERGGALRRSDGVRLEGRRAVVVDDDPAVVWFLSGLLRTSGVEVAEAHDGLRARDLVLEGFPDLVVSDVLMPGLDGFSLCRDVKRDVAVRDVPVILLSWKEDLLQRVRELGAGADGYLRKEAAASTVLSRIREVMRPRARVESRLASGGEVRGRLDGLTTRTLLELCRRHLPSSRIVVRDSVYLYEIEMRDGSIRCVTRTAADGSFERGARVLDALIGVTAGRFVVVPSAAPARQDFTGTLDELVKPRVRRARALARLFEGSELDQLDSVIVDGETVGAYLDSTPEPARGLFAKLLGGARPRELLAEAPSQRYFLEQVLADIARRGAVIEVVRDGQPVDLEASVPAPEVGTELPLEPSPGPLFTLDLSPAPPDLGDSVARWEKPDVVLREASAPLPFSRTVTPVPVMAPEASQPFPEEPRTAPGMGPVRYPLAPEPTASAEAAPVASAAPAEPAEPAEVEPAAEPALETARSEEVQGREDEGEDEDERESPVPLVSQRESPVPLVSQRETHTPETLRAEPSPAEHEAQPKSEKAAMNATLPSAKPIEFPRKKATGAAAPPASKRSAAPRPAPAKALAQDKPMGMGKIALIMAAAAVTAFFGVTWVRTKLLTPPTDTTQGAAPVESAAPVAAKPAAAPVVKLAVEELGLDVGTPVSSDKGVIEVSIGENHPVYVDGTFVGRGPKRKVPVSAGPHAVVIKAPDGDLSVQVEVKVGRRFLVSRPAATP